MLRIYSRSDDNAQRSFGVFFGNSIFTQNSSATMTIVRSRKQHTIDTIEQDLHNYQSTTHKAGLGSIDTIHTYLEENQPRRRRVEEARGTEHEVRELSLSRVALGNSVLLKVTVLGPASRRWQHKTKWKYRVLINIIAASETSSSSKGDVSWKANSNQQMRAKNRRGTSVLVLWR